MVDSHAFALHDFFACNLHFVQASVLFSKCNFVQVVSSDDDDYGAGGSDEDVSDDGDYGL